MTKGYFRYVAAILLPLSTIAQEVKPPLRLVDPCQQTSFIGRMIANTGEVDIVPVNLGAIKIEFDNLKKEACLSTKGNPLFGIVTTPVKECVSLESDKDISMSAKFVNGWVYDMQGFTQEMLRDLDDQSVKACRIKYPVVSATL